MNGLLLNFTKEDEIIKSNSKKVQNAHSYRQTNESDTFAFLMENILSNIPEGKEKTFLMNHLFHQDKNISQNSTELLRAPFSDAPLIDNNKQEENAVTFETLLDIVALLQTHDAKTPLHFPTQSPKLQTALLDVNVQDAFKQAHTVKDLLNLAEKLKIPVKHITFMKEEAALDNKTRQIARTLGSTAIFNLIKKESFVSKVQEEAQKRAKVSTPHPTEKLQKSDKNMLQTLLSESKPVSRKPQYHTQKIKTDQAVHQNDSSGFSKKSPLLSNTNTQTAAKIQTLSKETLSGTEKHNRLHIDSFTADYINREKRIESAHNRHHHSGVLRHDKDALQSSLAQTHQRMEHTISNTLANIANAKTFEPFQNVSVSTNTVTNDTIPSTIKIEPVAEQNTQHSSHTVSHETKTEISSLHKKETPVPLKQTFESFTQDFKEYVERYKPPLMKIKMQLNPGTLGDVDVTLVNRGNNLHVTIQSNPNTIALFAQNQTEFKNTLINMGFTGLQMSFGENRDGNKGQHHTKTANGTRHTGEEEHQESEHFEMVVPRYV